MTDIDDIIVDLQAHKATDNANLQAFNESLDREAGLERNLLTVTEDRDNWKSKYEALTKPTLPDNRILKDWPQVPVWGVCPSNPGGTSLAAANLPWTKYGKDLKFPLRQFMGSSSILKTGPWLPTNSIFTLATYNNFVDADVNAGKVDGEIDALLLRAADSPYRFILGGKHESDNDGLTGDSLVARARAQSRFYHRKETLGLGEKVLICQVLTGGFWASYGTAANRKRWLDELQGDLYGIDFDGVADKTGPTYDMVATDELGNALEALKTYASSGFKKIVFPEIGTPKQLWDKDGVARTNWMRNTIGQITHPLVMGGMFYDYNTTSNPGPWPTRTENQMRPGTPDFAYVTSLMQGNRA